MTIEFKIETEDDLDEAIEKLENLRYDLQYPNHVAGEWESHHITTDEQDDRTRYDLSITYHRSDFPEGWFGDDWSTRWLIEYNQNVMLWHYPADGFCFILAGVSLSAEDFIKQIVTIKQDIKDPICTPTESHAERSGGLLIYLPAGKGHSGKNWDFLNTMTLEPKECTLGGKDK